MLPPNHFPYIPPGADPDPGTSIVGPPPPGVVPGPGPALFQPVPYDPPPPNNNGAADRRSRRGQPPAGSAAVPPMVPCTRSSSPPPGPPEGTGPAYLGGRRPDLRPRRPGPQAAGPAAYTTHGRAAPETFRDPKGGTGIFAGGVEGASGAENWLDLMLVPRPS